jgi:hypothetical protein
MKFGDLFAKFLIAILTGGLFATMFLTVVAMVRLAVNLILLPMLILLKSQENVRILTVLFMNTTKGFQLGFSGRITN